MPYKLPSTSPRRRKCVFARRIIDSLTRTEKFMKMCAASFILILIFIQSQWFYQPFTNPPQTISQTDYKPNTNRLQTDYKVIQTNRGILSPTRGLPPQYKSIIL